MACEREHSQKESANHHPQHPQPETKYFIHDAMPFWWMSHLLLNHLSTAIEQQSSATSTFYVGITPADGQGQGGQDQGEGVNRFCGVDLSNMYQAARGIAASGGLPS